MAPRLILKRAITGPDGTWGFWAVEGHAPFCLALEPPWMDNQVGLSCIKPGTYPIRVVTNKRRKWPKAKAVVEIFREERTGRAGVFIHNGQISAHTQGCPMTGTGLGELIGRPALTNSVKALEILVEKINDHGITELLIKQIGEV